MRRRKRLVTRSGADALLFDLGKVVIDIDFDRALARWAEQARCDQALLAARFSHDEAYRLHEIGQLDQRQYFAALRGSLGVDLSDEQLLDGWNAIFVGEMAGMSELLIEAARRRPLYAFTNTNPTHERCFSTRFAGVLGHFRAIYASSTIGLRKPDAAAFDYVVKAIGVPAERIVFFDDSLENVRGARACNLQAVHVTSRADIASTIAALAR
jgi:FMN phosphatase YigB (HAD superfamily)